MGYLCSLGTSFRRLEALLGTYQWWDLTYNRHWTGQAVEGGTRNYLSEIREGLEELLDREDGGRNPIIGE